MNIYDFKVLNNKNEEVSLSKYQGKVIIIINSATKCGLTPQYEGLEALYEKYHNQGLVILDFPSNQFMNQAPGSDDDIQAFCTLHFNTTFDRFSKIDVNGKNANELFVWLKEQQNKDTNNQKSSSFNKKIKLLKPFAKESDIKWNFTKFLIDREGNVVNRYAPAYTAAEFEDELVALLNK